MATEKSEFENVSGGWIGVQVRDDTRRSGFKGIGLGPGARVWLDEDEQTVTANRPRNPEDNPFINGHLKLTASKQEMQNRRPIGDSMEPQAPTPPETPPEAPQGDGQPEGAPEGETPPTEPEAPATPPQKSEEDMTAEEITAANAKAAAARAIPTKQPPAPEPTPERVATPEAVAAAGAKPEGKRGPTEQVGTPSAQKK